MKIIKADLNTEPDFKSEALYAQHSARELDPLLERIGNASCFLRGNRLHFKIAWQNFHFTSHCFRSEVRINAFAFGRFCWLSLPLEFK